MDIDSGGHKYVFTFHFCKTAQEFRLAWFFFWVEGPYQFCHIEDDNTEADMEALRKKFEARLSFVPFYDVKDAWDTIEQKALTCPHFKGQFEWD